MIRQKALFSSAALVILLLAGCGSTGGLGDILGGGSSGSGNTRVASEIRGTVDQVDTRSQSLLLINVSNYDSRLSDGGGGNSVRVYFDDRTRVEY